MSPNQMPRKAAATRTTKRWADQTGRYESVAVIRPLGKPNRLGDDAFLRDQLLRKVGLFHVPTS